MVTPGFWRGRDVFLTGHTGFKGAWLSLVLHRLGASVTGYALSPPSQPNLFSLAGIGSTLQDIRADIRDRPALIEAMETARPQVVIHFAAQALVRQAYLDPAGTFEDNVMGTVNVLDAARTCRDLRAVLIITTDKCYENREWVWAYREQDRLGGRDPYSASKAAAELATRAFRDSFFSGPDAPAIATARAGNVIGGGDWAADRLLPDIIRAYAAGKAPCLRYPDAIRPWQHVLDPLHGYLSLAEALSKSGADAGGAWNFGPDTGSEHPVADVLEKIGARWGELHTVRSAEGERPHEASFLKLDSAKARSLLGWQPCLDFDTALDWTVDWYRAHAAGEDMRALTLRQIDRFLACATTGLTRDLATGASA
jgi:CDP-glucose 4,6-dehydratase